MIESISIRPALFKSQHHFAYAADLGLPKQFQFTDGLNIIVGDNGSGKSTLLRILAAGSSSLMHGHSAISMAILQSAFDIDNQDRYAGIDVAHDGQVVYIDAGSESLLRKAEASSSDFGYIAASFVKRAMKSQSSGQVVLKSIEPILQLMRQEVAPDEFVDVDTLVEKRLARYKRQPNAEKLAAIRKEVVEDIRKNGKYPKSDFPKPDDQIAKDLGRFNKVWQERYRIQRERRFEPKIPVGKPTLILDEPENRLSLPLQARFWNLVTHPKVLEKFQIIVATHSLFGVMAAKNVKANTIELTPGFLEAIKSEINMQLA